MKKILIVALTAFALPATAIAADAAAPTPKEAAKAACKAQRTQMGKALYKQTYRSEGLGKCISKVAKTEAANQDNAAKQCKAERADANFAAGHDGKTFDQLYGTNKNGKNAYGKCVSTKAKAKSEAQTAATVSAAKSCKKAKKDDAEAFKTTYGSSKNAFGKCVSAAAKAKS
jgi:pullulanase/glycogen debranching enzyme